MASIDIIIMSSITATPRIIVVASSLIMSSYSKMRITITVLVTEIASAKKRLSETI
jgi:hypothetical protein